MKIARIIFFIAFVWTSAAAQSGRPAPVDTRQPVVSTAPQVECQLSLSQVPSLLGFRLGMTMAEAQANHPRLKIPPPDEVGVAPVYLIGVKLNEQLGLTGPEEIRDVVLEFTDGRLSFIRVGYPLTNRWRSADEFVAVIAEKFSLSGTWDRFYDLDDKSFRGMEDFRDIFLECKGFRIAVGIGTEGLGEQTPHIKLEDMLAAETVKKRRDEKSRREAETQKP
jgi:hypothetical protein